ncbi:tryptophan synthase subunit alpha [Corticibacter populi]|uniref:Tryptophan synthase alpha chain n=1 Tax=Corticibacter populi TaxID=1550736 RepID=A0A3M6QYB5_9BURK|nr:tryptophan synthase subunit alpha [Corticibacter populi]RMX08010.1 tryptophan synthase subunit alpha [Corticibacter populi]RZS35253.1 tryptophan synthase alpha chain [Corticibacter populi]
MKPSTSTSRIANTFAQLQAAGRKALIPFVTAGFPEKSTTTELMHAMHAAGADIIELGVPFSDPSADGTTIQQAGDVALANGTGLVQVLEYVHEFRQRNQTTPVVLMGYANPIERYDQLRSAGAFVRDAAAAGVDGLLVVDYPPEEAQALQVQLRAHGMDLIFLLAPTSTEARMAQINEVASGYVYYVSLKGVTGSKALDTAQVAETLPRIRQHVQLPVGVGFGIRDAETAKAIAQTAKADAVVIGSRLIELLRDNPGEQAGIAAVCTFLRDVRQAVDA